MKCIGNAVYGGKISRVQGGESHTTGETNVKTTAMRHKPPKRLRFNQTIIEHSPYPTAYYNTGLQDNIILITKYNI